MWRAAITRRYDYQDRPNYREPRSQTVPNLSTAAVCSTPGSLNTGGLLNRHADEEEDPDHIAASGRRGNPTSQEALGNEVKVGYGALGRDSNLCSQRVLWSGWMSCMFHDAPCILNVGDRRVHMVSLDQQLTRCFK